MNAVTRGVLAALCGLCGLVVVREASPATWTVEAFGGTAWHAPTRLEIRQAGEDEIALRAHYRTRPLADSPYYAWRVGSANERGAWELWFVHHKLYLSNEPPEVQHFEVTHGYNLVMASRAMPIGQQILRAAAGAVVYHSETEVRGRAHHSSGGVAGYELGGPTVAIGVGRQFRMTTSTFATLELAASASSAHVSVDGGEAWVPNVALHLLVGVGYRHPARP